MTVPVAMLASMCLLLVVLLAILIALSEGQRRYRVGVTLLTSWCISAIGVYGLHVIGQPLDVHRSWWLPVGFALSAWALWDVSRLARHYGTTALIQAADVARGLLLSDRTSSAIWSAWARNLPSAAWVKGRDGVMLAINARYEHDYGKPDRDYTGARDGEVWGAQLADEFAANDQHVFCVGHPIIVVEDAPTFAHPHRRATIMKFPVRDRRGDIVGVGGIELTKPADLEVVA